MGVTIKGKKGFQSVPKNKQRTQKQYYYLSKVEEKQLKKYLKANDIKHSHLIRTFLKDIIGGDAE